MRLDLRNVIHIPDAKAPFQLQVDLSDLEFYGRKPIVRPVQAQGCVTNHAGALVLEGTARSELDLVCDRCGKPFTREKVVALNSLVAQELEDEENDDILLLEGTQLLFVGDRDSIRQAFNVEDAEDVVFLPKVMSRKKQVIPMLSALWG